MKKRKKILFFIIALIVALFLDLTFITIDFFRIKGFEEPIFAYCKSENEEVRIYNGIGYSFEVQGKFELDDELYGITRYKFYILDKYIRGGIRENVMSFEELQSVDIRTVRPEDVVDIRQIKIEEGLLQQEKRREFIRQVKNPYCFRVGNVIVKASYSGNGVSLNERFEELVMSV